ncbi:MAG: BrnA antitoxin family protein [Clostridiales bacterium]|nr:BrnA antitoxin family protein [Clostridiales bacterium]
MKSNNDKFILKDEYDFSEGIRGRFYSPTKKSITIRLDDDVILKYKKKASEQKIGYQTLMNSALREHIETYRASKKTGD